MPQFVVAGDDDATLAKAVREVYPNDHIKVWSGLWLVSDTATAQQVALKLGTSDGTRGRVLVTSINGYFGYARTDIWEWLAVKGTPKHGSE